MMSIGMQTPHSIVSMFRPFEPQVLNAYGTPKQGLLASTQPMAQEFVEATSHPETAARWLTDLLNLLAGIVNRNEDLNRVVVTETEYQQLLAVLEDLIYGVGEDEDHPLSETMALVGVLIKAYEDAHFPKLADLYPELAQKIKVELVSEGRNCKVSTLERTETDLVPAVFFSIGFILSEAGKAEEAICAYDLALRLKSDYAGAYSNRGIVKSEIGKHKEAVADHDKAIELDPANTDAYYNRGKAKGRIGQLEAAIEDYNKAISGKKSDAEVYVNRGAAKAELGQLEAAVKDYDKAIDLNPTLATAYANRGNVNAGLDRYSEAVADHDKAVCLSPNSAEIRCSRGIAKMIFGQYDTAIMDFNEAIRLNPDYTDAYYNRGAAKGILKRYNTAITDFDEVIRINPDYVDAYYNRGAAKYALGRCEKAKSDFQIALELAEQQGKEDLKTNMEQLLQELKKEK